MARMVVTNTGATVRARGILYKVVTKSVLLYGKKSWVVKVDMIKLFERFHNWVARNITGMTAHSATSGEGECPPADEVLDTAVWQIKEYIQQRQDTVAEQVACRPIYEM